MSKRMSLNELIGYLVDRPEIYVVQTITKRGPIWHTSGLLILSPSVCLAMVGKQILIVRDPATVPTGPAGHQSYELNPKYRATA